jgi:hypothetical protein
MKKITLLLMFIIGSDFYAQIPEDDVQVKNLYDFYKEMIQKSNNLQGAEYRPQVEKGKKGYAVLTVDKYCKALTASGYFTTGFIESERAGLKACADGIAKTKYSIYEQGEIVEYPEGCGWAYYDRWFHAQDNPDFINVTWTRSLDENSIEALFDLMIGTKEDSSKWEQKCRAVMMLENGAWRIDALEIN